MDRVEEIESAIDRLPPEDYKRVVAWLLDHEQSRWDEQMDRDSSEGRLDFLFTEAEYETAAGPLRDRIGEHYRAMGRVTGDTITWVWIGAHTDYDRLVG